jgi:hypothetical protein
MCRHDERVLNLMIEHTRDDETSWLNFFQSLSSIMYPPTAAKLIYEHGLIDKVYELAQRNGYKLAELLICHELAHPEIAKASDPKYLIPMLEYRPINTEYFWNFMIQTVNVNTLASIREQVLQRAMPQTFFYNPYENYLNLVHYTKFALLLKKIHKMAGLTQGEIDHIAFELNRTLNHAVSEKDLPKPPSPFIEVLCDLLHVVDSKQVRDSLKHKIPIRLVMNSLADIKLSHHLVSALQVIQLFVKDYVLRDLFYDYNYLQLLSEVEAKWDELGAPSMEELRKLKQMLVKMFPLIMQTNQHSDIDFFFNKE